MLLKEPVLVVSQICYLWYAATEREVWSMVYLMAQSAWVWMTVATVGASHTAIIIFCIGGSFESPRLVCLSCLRCRSAVLYVAWFPLLETQKAPTCCRCASVPAYFPGLYTSLFFAYNIDANGFCSALYSSTDRIVSLNRGLPRRPTIPCHY